MRPKPTNPPMNPTIHQPFYANTLEPYDTAYADAEWPIVAKPYDPVPVRHRRKQTVIIWIGISAALLILLLIAVNLPFTLPQAVFVVLGCLLITAVTMALAYWWDDRRQLKLPATPGYVITGRAIQQAYAGRIPIQRLTLTTPIIRHDVYSGSDLDYFLRYEILPNDVSRLWFQPTRQVHSYWVYWSDRDYGNLATMHFQKYNIGGYAKATRYGLRISTTFMRRIARKYGVDLRMRPCILEVYGTRARLILPPNAPELETGPMDTHIGNVIDDVAMLLDTFGITRSW
ncbi:hypothetical protein D2E25_1074 [Bifidobacterium goeldii]|uniref:DUF3137 domain-containing protein n=1 Tax=Bifidobacterium goeldii TaxID=2306975 RepID=A0A430FK29_9BIFI|nr:hypothetical protein [Bifidobacterium goeldii]RSX53101.1 hypothetical protein D2E25_1074 [Bifidobacterium goeldii]